MPPNTGKGHTSLPIAVIMATPPGFNPGMLFCELTADAVLRHIACATDRQFYRLIPIENRFHLAAQDERARAIGRCDLGLDMALLTDLSMLADRTPLYWGDFLHMRHYLAELAPYLGSGQAGEALARRLLLLDEAPDALLRRAVSFGSTLLFNSATDLLSAEYGDRLARLVRSARLVMVRDIVSAAQISTLTGPEQPSALGLDPAQMVALFDDWRSLFRGTPPAPAAAAGGLVFLGRAAHDQFALRFLLDRLREGLGLSFAWLPWGDASAFPLLHHQPGDPWELPTATDPAASLATLIAEVAAARLVVTDTYHLAVIAWSLGTPAVMLTGQDWRGAPERRCVNSGPPLARIDKRFVFFARHGLLEFLLEPTLLSAPELAGLAAENIAALVRDGRVLARHQAELRGWAVHCAARLRTALEAAAA